MTFLPGHSYYVLTPGERSDMIDMLAEEGLDYDLADDFTLASDGNYYVDVTSSSLSGLELAFMEDWGFGERFEYKKSTQSTSPLD